MQQTLAFILSSLILSKKELVNGPAISVDSSAVVSEEPSSVAGGVVGLFLLLCFDVFFFAFSSALFAFS